ncbi:flagellar basal-body MS-ring/collar protein FliF [Cupriavidus basilensis]|uniref:Flagellar basal-body MS-ring/collar protein FliF n=1 Tax=Cupriavidus basilensis TaxID=68895 RepID=A0ABT6AWH9_9BURK|nr:flagellar basal-body MS-ring/collar protein FliF [Cupriavidus basilensis]MDF3836829.1 flagellar basal-body MS-ring/collar protein FliF [Cupriavidus basilensis]
MATFSGFLRDRPRGQQLAITFAVMALLVVLLVVAYIVWRPTYGLLFSGLKPADAAAIVRHLEKEKTPYRLADGGSTILVPQENVHAARLRVMSEDIPLKGSVGFELFNNSDLGMTEFTQKVNYQRALQGELTRTILSLREIESARVHLAIPEASIFRKNASRPKASIVVSTREGTVLSTSRIRSIQRLVGAAIPELDPAEVTVTDQRLTAGGEGAAAAMISDPKLELKAELERYYAGKVREQLGSLVGKQLASVAVDVQVNYDRLQVSNEVTRTRRPVVSAIRPASEAGTDANSSLIEPARIPRAKAISAETGVEETSRRVEQAVTEPGSIRRLSVAVVLNAPPGVVALSKVQELASAAVGLNTSRGDTVSVAVREGFPQLATPALPAAPATAPSSQSEFVEEEIMSASPVGPSSLDMPRKIVVVLAGLALLAIVFAAGVAFGGKRRDADGAPRRLTREERDAYTRRLQELLGKEAVSQ